MSTATKSGSKDRKQAPFFSEAYFPIQVAVFEHEVEGSRPNYSVKVSRRFRRDDESEWETSEYLRPQDLLPAARLLEKAFDAIQARIEKAFRDQRQEFRDDGGNNGRF